MNETLQAYFLSVGEALSRHDEVFRKEHPALSAIDAAFVAEVTLDGQPMLGSISSIDSTKGQADRDLLNSQRIVTLCIQLVRECTP